MSSIECLVKDKRTLIYEILFSLEGIVGDLIELDVNRDSKYFKINDLTLNSTISLSEINLIKRLLEIGNNYNKVNHFVQKFSSDSNSYNRRLAQTIDELLVYYRNDLIEVEKDINRDSNYCLIKFNQFFKYSQTFEFLNQIVSHMNEEICSYGSTLDLLNKSSFSGFSQIQNSAKIIQRSNDCLYSDIFSWILFGFLSTKSRNHFFIKETDCEGIRLDTTRVPPFLDPRDAYKILKIGETVRWCQSRGVKSLFANKENELFEYLRNFKNKQNIDKTSFTEFLEFVRKIVSEHTWNYVVNEQPFIEILYQIKDIYLTSSDNFWTSFVSHSSKLLTNGHKCTQKEIENGFDISLRRVFSDNTVNQLMNRFSISVPKNGNNYLFFIDYEIPVSIQNIISNESLDKYNKIMNFMAKLYISRLDLNQIWLKTLKGKFKSMTSLRLKIFILRNSLSFLINCFYNYFKTDVIERLFEDFMIRIEKTKDIEVIQKEHQIVLIDIIGQMFLKTSVIINCLEKLFVYCNQFKRSLDSEDSINQLIEDFERTKGQIYHLLVNIETYKTNKMISNLILEIEKCSKQRIILN